MTEQAGIYCRLSLARFGDTTKVEDQERVCRDLCEKRGWKVAEVFTDNNRSAWQRDRKRPGWDAMLEAVGKGRLTAIVVYHGDRLVRQPFDLEQLLNLSYGRGIKLASPTGTRDLGNEDDLFILRIEVAAQCRESASTSRRKKAGFARMARDGIAPVPGGRYGRGFGYEKDGRTHHPAEARALRDAAARVLKGDSLTLIARDLTYDGIFSTSGQPLDYKSLNRILTRPRIAGLLPSGQPGSWDPILDRETWELCRSILAGRKTHAGGGAKYLLSGIATCWACGHPVQRQSAAQVIGYGCVTPGCRKVHRNMRLLDAFVGAAVVERLNDSRNPPGRILDQPGLSVQFIAMTEARAELAGRLADPAQPYADLLLQRLTKLDEKLSELGAAAGADTVRHRVLTDHAGITWEQWLALPLGTRRALVTALYSITLKPVTRRGPGFSPDDVDMTPL